MKNKGKKAIAVGTVFLGGLTLLRSSYERRTLSFKSYEFKDSRIKKHLRLAFLTDLHANSFGTFNETLIRAVLDAGCDAVLIGGDMMVTKPGKPMNFSALEDLLKGIYGTVPIYYAEGNHELRMKVEAEKYPGWWEEFDSLLRAYDVHYLLDETVDLSGNVYLSGLEIEPELYTKFMPRKMPEGYLHEHLPDTPSDEKFHVVMAHNPRYMDNYWEEGANLVLCGHYHGGVVGLPHFKSLVAPDFRLFPKYSRGMYTDGSHGGVVSAGLGTHTINVRLLNKPELVVVDLLPEMKS